jgi:Cu/Ag efflux pump CusA
LSGETAQVAIKVYGEDLDALDRVGEEIQNALTKETGVVDLQVDRQAGTPTFAISLDTDALAANGVKTDVVLETLASYYAGATAGQTYAGTRLVDVVVLMDDDLRHRVDHILSMLIASPFGPVPLSQLARVAPISSRYSIEHDGGQRRVSVTFNVVGRSLDSAVAEARRRIASIALPVGTYLEFTGAAEEERRTRNEIVIYSACALVFIVMLLFMCFRWRAHPWLVMANLPFSLIGGIFAVAVSGIGLSLGAIVGLVTVFGISARNAILLLAHYEHLVETEGAPWNAETIARGAQERLVPILMTALVTALGLMPLAFGTAQPGQEIEGPMAITVLGGLFSSTLLNLVLLPALVQRHSLPGSAPQWEFDGRKTTGPA